MTDSAPRSSIEYHQKLGAALDIIDEAILTYDQWMLDDDYDSMAVLHKIIGKMKERRDLCALGEGVGAKEE